MNKKKRTVEKSRGHSPKEVKDRGRENGKEVVKANPA